MKWHGIAYIVPWTSRREYPWALPVSCHHGNLNTQSHAHTHQDLVPNVLSGGRVKAYHVQHAFAGGQDGGSYHQEELEVALCVFEEGSTKESTEG
jgi:hypothetical protein